MGNPSRRGESREDECAIVRAASSSLARPGLSFSVCFFLFRLIFFFYIRFIFYLFFSFTGSVEIISDLFSHRSLIRAAFLSRIRCSQPRNVAEVEKFVVYVFTELKKICTLPNERSCYAPWMKLYNPIDNLSPANFGF